MLRVEIKRETDGRWLGEIPELPGVMAYGATEAEARTNTIALAFGIVDERIAHGRTRAAPGRQPSLLNSALNGGS